MSSLKSQLKQERKKKWKTLKPPEDSKFPELKAGYPDSFIQEHADAKSFHMDKQQPVTSMLATGDYYQYRGPRFVFQTAARKKIYSDYGRSLFNTLGVFNGQSYKGCKPPLYVWADETRWKQVATFPEAGDKFPGDAGVFYYLSDVGQRRPYPWQAHHLLPESTFTEENSKFTEEQMQVLDRSFYNINNGHNIMMLPSDDRYVPVHGLIAHSSSHPNYTFRVKLRMERLSTELEGVFKKARKAKEHLSMFKAVLKSLYQLEDEFWDFVIALSAASIAAALEDIHEEAVEEHGGTFSYATTDKKGKVTRRRFAVLR
ncbi:AHH domain-containing protein [Pyxidicoccus caerfyrddinensis]|uniref:AHH domain-containing protein n=1 Tax=Pyxidicoccus caerfyrddinensis TaxID=2709663 RepID=UPI0013DA25E4|nr:AHH domain-containing protein [Pyxidicoccus caerfyrddinensis]